MIQIGFGACFAISTQFSDMPWIAFGWLMATGFFSKSVTSQFWTIPPLLFSPGVAGGARGFINAIGNLGGLVAPWVVGWLTTLYGNTKYGVIFLGCCLVLGGLLSYLLPGVTAGKSADQSAAAKPAQA